MENAGKRGESTQRTKVRERDSLGIRVCL
jgi:hypothetical protein